jgi:hypothetical protein
MGHLIPAGTGLYRYSNIKIAEEMDAEELIAKDIDDEALQELMIEIKESAS